MHTGDTIAAIATGHAHARRGVVRLSGPDALDAVRRLLDPHHDIDPERAACPIGLRLPPDGELPATVLVMPGPASYTGEDAAELIVPGNPLLMRVLLAELLDHPGVRAATPGEFTARAYLNGRLTAEQAEGVGALIHARSASERQAALQLLDGELGHLYHSLTAEVADALALVEAGIDFTDQEDVVAIGPAELSQRLAQVSATIADMLGAAAGERRGAGLPVVALVGQPNAGKSTLFNALLGRIRTVVSDLPGTTRDIIREPMPATPAPSRFLDPASPHAANTDDAEQPPANAPTGVVELVDLAGLDQALLAPAPSPTHEPDADAQHAARDAVNEADLLLWCEPRGRFDHHSPVGSLIERRQAAGASVIRVRTKADLPAAAAPAATSPNTNDAIDATHTPLHVCALDGFNLEPLRRAIIDAALTPHPTAAVASSAGAATLLTRHRLALTAALDPIERALQHTESQHHRHLHDPELVALLLRDALDHLGELAGRTSPDDIIGRVFATFCVGK
jgi:tRNA modification GTPase